MPGGNLLVVGLAANLIIIILNNTTTTFFHTSPHLSASVIFSHCPISPHSPHAFTWPIGGAAAAVAITTNSMLPDADQEILALAQEEEGGTGQRLQQPEEEEELLVVIDDGGPRATTNDAVCGDQTTSNEVEEKVVVGDKLLLFTVATDPQQDGLRRLAHSAQHHGHRLHVVGLGERWIHFGTKLKAIHRTLTREYIRGANILLFVDGYDVVVDATEAEILARFRRFFAAEEAGGARIVFGAELFCYPDASLAPNFPEVWLENSSGVVVQQPQRYLNSGLFIGFAEDLLRLWDEFLPAVEEGADDQEFYSRLYIDETIRTRYRMALDHQSLLFQNFPTIVSSGKQADETLLLRFDKTGNSYVYNSVTGTTPLLLHGMGLNPHLNTLGNYIAGRYNLYSGCSDCDIIYDDLIVGEEGVENKIAETWPSVGIALVYTECSAGSGGNRGGSGSGGVVYWDEKRGIFIAEDATTEWRLRLEAVHQLDYPREKVALLMVNNCEEHSREVSNFIAKSRALRYHSVKNMVGRGTTARSNDEEQGGPNSSSSSKSSTTPKISRRMAKLLAIRWAKKHDLDFLFLLDMEGVHLTNRRTLKRLVRLAEKFHLGFLSPMLPRLNQKPTEGAGAATNGKSSSKKDGKELRTSFKPPLHNQVGKEGDRSNHSCGRKAANFWGEVNGYVGAKLYGTIRISSRRSIDYDEIVSRRRQNYWNVACITSAVLIAKWKFDAANEAFMSKPGLDPAVAFCNYALEAAHHMFVDNQEDYGYVLDDRQEQKVVNRKDADECGEVVKREQSATTRQIPKNCEEKEGGIPSRCRRSSSTRKQKEYQGP